MPAIILAMLSEALLDHFRNPRNAGELPGATARIEVSNPVCGDVLRLAAVFEDGVVREVGFLCRGCTASIACASLLTESMRGRELRGLRKITAESLSEALGPSGGVIPRGATRPARARSAAAGRREIVDKPVGMGSGAGVGRFWRKSLLAASMLGLPRRRG